MVDNLFDDDDDNINTTEMPTINPLEIKEKFSEYSSKRLCDIIVCDRYLGINKELAVFCMEELAKRRTNGESFDYETYIEESFKDLPVLDFSIPDLGDVLSKISGKLNK